MRVRSAVFPSSLKTNSFKWVRMEMMPMKVSWHSVHSTEEVTVAFPWQRNGNGDTLFICIFHRGVNPKIQNLNFKMGERVDKEFFPYCKMKSGD